MMKLPFQKWIPAAGNYSHFGLLRENSPEQLNMDILRRVTKVQLAKQPFKKHNIVFTYGEGITDFHFGHFLQVTIVAVGDMSVKNRCYGEMCV